MSCFLIIRASFGQEYFTIHVKMNIFQCSGIQISMNIQDLLLVSIRLKLILTMPTAWFHFLFSNLVLLIHFCHNLWFQIEMEKKPTTWLLIDLPILCFLSIFAATRSPGKEQRKKIRMVQRTKPAWNTWYASQMHTKDKRQSRHIFAGKQTKQIGRHVRNWKCTIVKCQRKHWKLDILKNSCLLKSLFYASQLFVHFNVINHKWTSK